MVASPSLLPSYVCTDVSGERKSIFCLQRGSEWGCILCQGWRDCFLRQNKLIQMWGFVSSALVGSSHISLPQVIGAFLFPTSTLTATANSLPGWSDICFVTSANPIMRTWVGVWQLELWWKERRSPPDTLRNLSIICVYLEPINFILSPSSVFSFVTLSRDAGSNQPALLFSLFFYKSSLKVLCVESLNSLFLTGGKLGVLNMFISVRSLNSSSHGLLVFSMQSPESVVTVGFIELDSQLQIPPSLLENFILKILFL